jgi:hypothetical protein
MTSLSKSIKSIYPDRTEWRNENRQLHREDGPAVELVDGTRGWYINDKIHRVDGPAIEAADGTRSWWNNGNLHRTDGPAAEWADGIRTWYVYGKKIKIY